MWGGAMSDKYDFPGLVVVEEPSASHGKAGVGVRYRDKDSLGPECAFTVEQLWPNGDTDAVHIPEDKMGEFIHTLIEAHMEGMDDG